MASDKESDRASAKRRCMPGMTPRSVMASVLCMLLAGIYTQYSMVYLAEGNQSPEQALPVPAMAVLLLLVLVGGGLFSLFKTRILSRAELLCVMFTMILAVPLMTQGFWHRFLGLISVPMRTASFDYMDAYSDQLWPHGPNLLADRMSPETLETRGTPPRWDTLEFDSGRSAPLPLLSNRSEDDLSAIRFRLPLEVDGRRRFEAANPHLISILARSSGMESESEIFCRVYCDDDEGGNAMFSERKAEKRTYLHPTGFVRIGAYGQPLATDCRSHLLVEFGLRGRGEVVFADPKLMSVAALEGAFRGRKIIARSEYERLPPSERPVGAAIKPDNMWSAAGIGFILSGYIPLREWIRPALVWSSYILMLCAAFFAANVIMRKKWAESERYPLPNTRIPLAMSGVEEPNALAFPSVWHNRFMWVGFLFAFTWGMLQGWHHFNPRIPDLSIRVPLGPYFTNPSLGGMFNVNFIVSIFVVSIAVFFELNVLMSLVVGYWIYRSLFWIGHWSNLKINIGFPWRYEQNIGGYLGYFFIVMILSRKYLWGVLKAAARGDPREPGEPLSSRAAVLLLLGCNLGVLVWARVVGASMLSMSVFFGFLAILGFVSAKFRAECGLPFGYFTPYNAMLFVSLCGGLAVFGAEGLLISLLLSGFLTVTVFFLVPGTQFELIQIGHRMGVRPRHILYTALLGILGGLFIGGWVFLSNAYAIGGDNIRFQWAFNGLEFYLRRFRMDLGRATAEMARMGESVAPDAPNWGARTMVVWGGITMVLTLLRQFFSKFWFHPIGFILGGSNLNDGANWGSLLVAWAIRALVLKIGGANAVRHKLHPFFVGAFVGALTVLLVFTLINGYSITQGSGKFYRYIP